MYLQGDLQSVFDALYHMGVIDPVLEMDWTEAMDGMSSHYDLLKEVINVANSYQNDVHRLMVELDQYDEEALGYLAMEVAREFADFHSREELH